MAVKIEQAAFFYLNNRGVLKSVVADKQDDMIQEVGGVELTFHAFDMRPTEDYFIIGVFYQGQYHPQNFESSPFWEVNSFNEREMFVMSGFDGARFTVDKSDYRPANETFRVYILPEE